MQMEGCMSHPLKGNARLQDPIVAPVENRECPVLMLEAGGPLLGLNYSLAQNKKWFLMVMFGVNKA